MWRIAGLLRWRPVQHVLLGIVLLFKWVAWFPVMVIRHGFSGALDAADAASVVELQRHRNHAQGTGRPANDADPGRGTAAGGVVGEVGRPARLEALLVGELNRGRN
jgi:hypothetical protein